MHELRIRRKGLQRSPMWVQIFKFGSRKRVANVSTSHNSHNSPLLSRCRLLVAVLHVSTQWFLPTGRFVTPTASVWNHDLGIRIWEKHGKNTSHFALWTSALSRCFWYLAVPKSCPFRLRDFVQICFCTFLYLYLIFFPLFFYRHFLRWFPRRFHRPETPSMRISPASATASFTAPTAPFSLKSWQEPTKNRFESSSFHGGKICQKIVFESHWSKKHREWPANFQNQLFDVSFRKIILICSHSLVHEGANSKH